MTPAPIREKMVQFLFESNLTAISRVDLECLRLLNKCVVAFSGFMLSQEFLERAFGDADGAPQSDDFDLFARDPTVDRPQVNLAAFGDVRFGQKALWYALLCDCGVNH